MDSFSYSDRLRSVLSPCLSCVWPCLPSTSRAGPGSPESISQHQRNPFFPDPDRERLLSDDGHDEEGVVTDGEGDGARDRRRQSDVWSLRSDRGQRLRRKEMGGHGASRWDLVKAWWAASVWRRHGGRRPLDIGDLGADDADDETTALAGHGWDDDPTFNTSGMNAKGPPKATEADAREIDEADLSLLAPSSRKTGSSSTSDSGRSGRKHLKASELELVNPPQDAEEEARLAEAEEAALRKERRRARRRARELGLTAEDHASEPASISDRGLEVPSTGGKSRSSRRRRESERGEGSSHGSSDRRGSSTALSPTLGSSDHGSSSRRHRSSKKKKSRTSHSTRSENVHPEAEWQDPVHVYYSWCAAYAQTYGAPVDEATAGWLWAQANGVEVDFEIGEATPVPAASGEATPQPGGEEAPEAGKEAATEARLNLSSEDFLKALKATKLPPAPPLTAPAAPSAAPLPPPPPPPPSEGIWTRIASAAAEASEGGRGRSRWESVDDGEGGGWGRWQDAGDEARGKEGESTGDSHSEHESS